MKYRTRTFSHRRTKSSDVGTLAERRFSSADRTAI